MFCPHAERAAVKLMAQYQPPQLAPEAGEALGSAPGAARQQKQAHLGGPPALMPPPLTRMLTRDWNHRFLISTNSAAESFVFLSYGRKVARMLDLPEQPSPRVPMIRQLPQRYRPIFVDGCREAVTCSRPVRKSGQFERWDGHAELYRAVFLPVGVRPAPLTSLIYGAFNRRILRKPTAPLGAG